MADCDSPADLFVRAARSGRTDEVERMLDSGSIKDVNAVDVSHCRALYVAAGAGCLDTCEVLLRRGAAVDAGRSGSTPLSLAASAGETGVCALLLSHGANVMSRHQDWTPLHFAASAGAFDVCTLLLSYGADASCVNNSRNTPLHLAGSNARVGVVSLLLDEAVDTHAVNDEGLTPLAETMDRAGLFGDHDKRQTICQALVAYGEFCVWMHMMRSVVRPRGQHSS